jgi:putative colanic acid biosynthesis acetyltransferase WcaF
MDEVVRPYPSSKIWAPWNPERSERSCFGGHVDRHSVDEVKIGRDATVSQHSYLCTASHDDSDPSMPLVTAPIVLGDRVWITADVFVGPGVSIGDGTVVTARSSVFNDLPSWTVARGNPAVAVKPREFCGHGHE